MELKLDVVAEGLGFPEGPVVTQGGTLFYVDIQQQTLMRLDPGASTPDVVAELPGGPNGLAIGPDGFGYVCNNGGVFEFDRFPPAPPSHRDTRSRNEYLLMPSSSQCPAKDYGKAHGHPAPDKDPLILPKPAGSIQRVNLKTGAVTELYGPATGVDLIAPDDIVFDAHGPEGSFWFTDCGYQNETVQRKGGVYAGHVNGTKPVRMADIPSPNGIGFSKDGKALYVADTLYGRLWELAIDDIPKGEWTHGQRPFTRKVVTPPGAPFPGQVILTLPHLQWMDSLKVEDGGKICVATLLSGGITVYDPVDGSTDFLPVGSAIPGMSLGDPFTSNFCFGGEFLTDVWITASASGKIYHGTWPRPGLKLAFND